MKTVALGEVAELRAGVGFPLRLQGRTAGDYPLAKVGDISRVGRSAEDVITTADNFVAVTDLATLKMKPVPAGSVLFAKIGEAIRHNHRVVAGRPLLIDNNAMSAIPRADLVDPHYLFRFMQSLDLYALASSTTVPSLRKSDLARIEVPVPRLPEQRRIAAILDHADALRTKRREILTHLDALTHSIFHEMFGDLQDGRWERIALGDVVSKIDSGASPSCESRRADREEWGILKLGAVTYGRFQPEQNKAYLGSVGSMAANEVRVGDVLMTRKNTRELVGAVALVDDVRPHLLLPDLIFRLHLDESRLDRRYFQALMMSERKRPAVRSLSSGSAGSMPNISKKRLATLPLELPPLALQRRFSERLEHLASQRLQGERTLAADDELFASLQARAFAGEL